MTAHENPPDEVRFIRVYVNLMSVTESQARSVFMYVCDRQDQPERTVTREITGFESLVTERLERSWPPPVSVPVSMPPVPA